MANAANTISVGSASIKRRIVNVAPAVAANDAVTLGQVRSLVAAQAAEIESLKRQLDALTLQVNGLKQ